MAIGCCLDETDSEEEAFRAQAPKTRCRRGNPPKPPKYPSIIRSSCLSLDASATELFTHWQSTGKIATMQTSSRKSREEGVMLLDAFSVYDERKEQHANFRDAILDALAEYIDDFGLWHFPYCLMYNTLTGSRVERLVAFYFALSHQPGHFQAYLSNRRFTGLAEEQLEHFPKDRTYREIWKEFMHCGRCAFHEHAGSKCWRPADVGPWEERRNKEKMPEVKECVEGPRAS